ncbi:hypothetical protein AcV5_000210 [Taiwanofungus camphoratus]|nr:hypothetical protein AcV5_000210 [Antrodia cinnamomea]
MLLEERERAQPHVEREVVPVARDALNWMEEDDDYHPEVWLLQREPEFACRFATSSRQYSAARSVCLL